MMKKFKKGEWIISEWKTSGDIDFIQFRERLDRTDFISLKFFRFKGNHITNLHNPAYRAYEPMFYNDHRLKYPFRKATLKEARKYKKLLREKGFIN